MQVTYHISIHASTLAEAVEKIGVTGEANAVASLVASGGAGTELKNLIGKFGLKPGLNCKCGQHIREMDAKGTDWCEQNIDTINGWLREEAERAHLPFTQIGATLLIRRAISNARKKQKGEQNMTVKLVVEIDTDDVYDAFTRTKPKEGKVTAATAEPPRPAPPQQPPVKPAG
jgi:hypothetical protein